MPYLLIFLGAFIAFAAWKQVSSKTIIENRIHTDEFIERDPVFQELGKDMPRVLETLGTVEARLDILQERLEDLALDVKSLINSRSGVSFSDFIVENEKEKLYKRVREEVASGKDIGELARELNMGKGEVELILNLHP